MFGERFVKGLGGGVVVPFLDVGRTDASVSFSNELVVRPNLQRMV